MNELLHHQCGFGLRWPAAFALRLNRHVFRIGRGDNFAHSFGDTNSVLADKLLLVHRAQAGRIKPFRLIHRAGHRPVGRVKSLELLQTLTIFSHDVQIQVFLLMVVVDANTWSVKHRRE